MNIRELFAVGNRGGNINQNKRENRMNNGNTMTAGPLTFEKELLPNGSDMGVVMFDKERAVECLARNFDENRNMRKIHAKRLADDMKNGRWHFTGAPIVFDAYGRLVDGQHRLNALIQAEVELPFIVVVNVQDRALHVMDAGAKRRNADVLTIEGYNNANNRASLVPMLKAYYDNNGNLPRRWYTSRAELLEVAQRFDNVDEALRVGFRANREKQLNVSAIAVSCIHYVCSKKDGVVADQFFNSFIDGVGLEKGDPVLALRRSLIYTRDGGNNGQYISAAKIAKAWNLKARGRTASVIRFSAGEAFPIIK